MSTEHDIIQTCRTRLDIGRHTEILVIKLYCKDTHREESAKAIFFTYQYIIIFHNYHNDILKS